MTRQAYVLVDAVLPPLYRLIERTGSELAAARLIGVSASNINRLVHHDRDNMRRDTARVIEALDMDPDPVPAPALGRVPAHELYRAVTAYATSHGNGELNPVLQGYAMRYGTSVRQAARDWEKVRTTKTIDGHLADRWATFIGLHMDVIWPEL